MSRLFFTDHGRVLMHHNEELGRWRWARKRLTLPAEAVPVPAELWLMAARYPETREPLAVHINGRAVAELDPATPPDPPAPARAGGDWQWHWWSVAVPANTLREGVNEITLTAGNPAMNGWILAIDNTADRGGSALSTDRGATWQRKRLGAHGALRGEYVVRLRAGGEALTDRRPPRVTYEDPAHPRVRELLELLPGSVRQQQDPWQQIRALRTWVATQWTHDAKGPAYAPWDPWTVLDWARRDGGHGRTGKVTMCVHFGSVFAALAAALGHTSRCIALSRSINGPEGHFVAEVYDHQRKQWVVHDANCDAHYELPDGRPLMAVDLADRVGRGEDCTPLARTGPGMANPAPHVARAFENNFANGISYRYVGVWPRNDYISDPTAAPPNHGSTTYCETDFIWYAPDDEREQGTRMFPYRRPSRRWFQRPPAKARTREATASPVSAV